LLKKKSVSEPAFHAGVDASSSNESVSRFGVPPDAPHTHSSALSTYFVRSAPPAHAIQRPSGDHSKLPSGNAPSLRTVPDPPAAGAPRETMPISVRLPSSTMPVGFHRNAIDFESGDHSGSETMNVPDVRRVCLALATSIVHRWLYCGISSSTT
jgi:hypothetical protein